MTSDGAASAPIRTLELIGSEDGGTNGSHVDVDDPGGAWTGSLDDAQPAALVYALSVAQIVTGPRPATSIRVLAVPGTFTLDDLHLCIEIAFGRSIHAPGRYLFAIGGRRLLPLDPELDPDDERVVDAEFTRIDDLALERGDRFEYRPDFLAVRPHRVVVETVRRVGREDFRPRCLEARGFAEHGAGSHDVRAIDEALAHAFPSLARKEPLR